MKIQEDSRGQKYYEILNGRITFIPNTWNNTKGIRIQAYTGKGKSLNQGAEFPIENKKEAFNFIFNLFKFFFLKIKI